MRGAVVNGVTRRVVRDGLMTGRALADGVMREVVRDGGGKKTDR